MSGGHVRLARDGTATTRAAVYARGGSDKQSERFVDCQIGLCRERAGREAWAVVDVFPDFSLSGATRDRTGLNAMLARIGEFDVVLVESLDRISRDQEDFAAIVERAEAVGCRLITVCGEAVR